MMRNPGTDHTRCGDAQYPGRHRDRAGYDSERVDRAGAAKPRSVNFASAGTGTDTLRASFSNPWRERTSSTAHKGAGAALVALLGGEVRGIFQHSIDAAPSEKRQAALALAWAALPPSMLLDLSTIAEGGVPGYDATTW
jgi:tripartite-type tricarboxylate transporter receptor subunit TctC